MSVISVVLGGFGASATRPEMLTSALIVGALSAAVLYYMVYSWKRRRMYALAAKIPGPTGLPVIGNVFDVVGDTEETVRKTMAQFRQYQPTYKYWLGPLLLVALTDPRDLEIVLNNYKYTDKSHFYNVFHPLGGQGVFNAAGDKWRRNRKIIAPAFNFNFLVQFVTIFHAMAMRLVGKMKARADGQSFDSYKLVELCTLDAIALTAMGVDVNAQDDDNSEWIRAIRRCFQITRERLVKPWLLPDATFYLTRDAKDQQKCLDIVNKFAHEVISRKKAEYRKAKAELDADPVASKAAAHEREQSRLRQDDDEDIGVRKKQTFLELLIERSESEDGCALTDVELRDEVVTLLIAGQDTTATDNCFNLLMLALHQDVQEAVHQELVDIMGEDPTTCPTYNDLNQMKHLERVIKETLRLYPSAPFIGRDLDHELDVTDYRLPAGCTVLLGLYGTHRLAEYWPEPDKFDPDRFLPERSVGRHPYAFVPFSGGPRNCVGQKYAMLQMKTILSTVIRHFQILPGKDCESMDKFRLQVDFSMTVAGGHNIRLVPRYAGLPERMRSL
ncbi:Cytochrome P450 4C1 [Frankliniella fusca]|uniref:Cytochrome P450 4C1 n=1 Tax=Frankliniella fusca TaxID=407009 RepID=A0AAE1LD77_9NEOP|nr:Cytochrome P450 4C1 [Frankliniella fusca]